MTDREQIEKLKQRIAELEKLTAAGFEGLVKRLDYQKGTMTIMHDTMVRLKRLVVGE